MAWVLFENTMLYLNKVEKSSASLNSIDKNITAEPDRFLELSDVRISLVFVSPPTSFLFSAKAILL